MVDGSHGLWRLIAARCSVQAPDVGRQTILSSSLSCSIEGDQNNRATADHHSVPTAIGVGVLLDVTDDHYLVYHRFIVTLNVLLPAQKAPVSPQISTPGNTVQVASMAVPITAVRMPMPRILDGSSLVFPSETDVLVSETGVV